MSETQNFRISVRNLSGIYFIPVTEKMKWGGVYERNNIENDDKSRLLFYTRGDADAPTGTEGAIEYSSHNASILFEWNIPWGFGEEKLTVTTKGDIKIEKSIWLGEEILRKHIEIVIYSDKK